MLAAASAPVVGKGAPKPFDPPKFDHPILSVFACLVQAESSSETTTKDQIVAQIDKAVAIMNGEVATYLVGLASEKKEEI